MSVKYENNDQLLNELRYTIRKSGKTQREIADNLNIKPQGLNKILNKKILALKICRIYYLLLDMNCILNFSL